MATWDKIDEESKSEKDDEEAILDLMANIVSDAESESDSDDDEEVFSKLTHEELVHVVKELDVHCLGKSKELRICFKNSLICWRS